MNPLTEVLLTHTAPVQWESLVERWQTKAPGIEHFPPPDDRPGMDEVIRDLDAVIEHATRLRGYLDGRYGHGCGDSGHADAVKQSNRLVKNVRTVLGFLVPRKDLHF